METTDNLPATTDLQSQVALLGLGGKTTFTQKEAEEVTGVKATRFFPFLQLLQKTSNVVGDYKPGTYLFRQSGQDKNPKNLGDSFDAYVLSVRGKATLYDKANEKVFAEYCTAVGTNLEKTQHYQEYLDAAHADSSPDCPYRAGLDVLLWIPQLKCFATYFANTISTTANVEKCIAPFAPENLGDVISGNAQLSPVRITSELRKNKKGTWFIPSAEESDTLTEPPSPEVLLEAAKLFLFPKASKLDEVPEGAEEATAETTTSRVR